MIRPYERDFVLGVPRPSITLPKYLREESLMRLEERGATEYTWSRFNDLIAELATKISNGNYTPQMLVAVARGGWIPVRFLSNLLSVKRLGSIGLEYTDESRAHLAVYSLPSQIEGARLLLVEDRLETARSMAKAREILLNKGCEVRTAALFIRTDSVIVPDYFLAFEDGLIRFPWEKTGK
jgi:hypoxanthine phosphoribosyltransferase